MSVLFILIIILAWINLNNNNKISSGCNTVIAILNIMPDFAIVLAQCFFYIKTAKDVRSQAEKRLLK